MEQRVHYGVGAHEPIYHRLRTGNATADEWERWEWETSDENIALLETLGISSAHIACSKGFGLEYEKPLIERAANFAERAAKRGITTSAYIQGFPIYYETFLLEKPEAENWLARSQGGDYIPWGGQCFRRWVDPTREEFLEYEMNLIAYILKQFKPTGFSLDNTVSPLCYTESAQVSFRNYLRNKFDCDTAFKQFGLTSFDAIDLPRIDPVYFPLDAHKIVKDPLLQEWARWRSHVTATFCKKLNDHIKSIDPNVMLASACGCDALRYNHLFNTGVDFEDRIDVLDHTHMEESGWRPGVIDATPDLDIVMDERHPLAGATSENNSLRVSTDSRFMKIVHNYGMGGGRGFWGEFTRKAKLVALSHNMTFCKNGASIGSVGPLAANPNMIDDIKDIIEWIDQHADVLSNRDDRIAPVAIWRSTSTIGFIRHTPVWQACAIEQMLYEKHIPFTILFDGGLEKFLSNRDLLILPGAECVSEKQVDLITTFVNNGGKLLLLDKSGTRDEYTRVRTKFAFAHLFELLGTPFPTPLII